MGPRDVRVFPVGRRGWWGWNCLRFYKMLSAGDEQCSCHVATACPKRGSHPPVGSPHGHSVGCQGFSKTRLCYNRAIDWGRNLPVVLLPGQLAAGLFLLENAMSKAIPLSFATFAYSLGAHHRITRDVSVVWHRQYVKADAVTRSALREEFIREFLVGYLTHGDNPMKPDAAVKRAKKIMGQSRDDRTKDDQKVYDAARAKFTYHVERRVKGEGNAKPSAKADPVADLITAYKALTAAQKRSFKAQVAKL